MADSKVQSIEKNRRQIEELVAFLTFLYFLWRVGGGTIYLQNSHFVAPPPKKNTFIYFCLLVSNLENTEWCSDPEKLNYFSLEFAIGIDNGWFQIAPDKF